MLWCYPYQDAEKVLPWTFSTTEPENAISRFLHFQWLTATENGGISLYRTQAVEKLRFSTACYVCFVMFLPPLVAEDISLPDA
ncbi:hypothetical protein [Thiolapillus sp.]